MPALPQMVVLGATFVLLATAVVAGYAWLAGSARRLIRRPRALAAVNRLGGSLLIGAGILTLGLRRAAG
jgi:threonine/homoserine/homoserine lactone efflux protein